MMVHLEMTNHDLRYEHHRIQSAQARKGALLSAWGETTRSTERKENVHRQDLSTD